MDINLTSEPLFTDNTVEHDGFTYFVVKDGAPLSIDALLGYDSIIIESVNRDFVYFFVTSIRKSLNHGFYLKPIFLLKSNLTIDPFIEELVDGSIFSLDQVKLVTPSVQKIFLKTNDIKINSTLSYEATVIVKMISFLYSRGRNELIPLPYNKSGIGFTYPILSVNFEYKEEHKTLDILELAEKEGLIYAEFNDKTHLCGQCHTGYLSYREVCPKCNSANSESQDIIHHFSCGFVGPLSDFQNEIDDALNCPKCNRTLRHIGVDYDKPSVLHECFNCAHKFQDFNVNARCMTCDYDNGVQHLISKEINNYTLSKKGELAALNGYTSTSKDIEQIIGTVKLDTFKTMLKYEIERIRQTEGRSNIGTIHITNAGEIYSQIGNDMQKSLLKDMVELVRRNIRSSDVITFLDSNTILLSMNDIPLKVGQNILAEITDMIVKLLKTNFKDLELDIRYNIKRINSKLNNELQIQQVVKDFYPNV